MMFTLIAVALGGYVMIESAPDFSNYAVLTRAQQFDRNMSALRQAVSSRRFFLTTSDGIDIAAAGDNPANELLTPDELQRIVSTMVVPAATTIRSSELSLSTTPVDPFVPSREWGEVFWAGSYNFLRNPAFYDDTRMESRDPTALRLFYVHENGGGNTGLATTDRIARVQKSLLSPGSVFQHVSVSPDGSRFISSTDLLHPAAFYDVVSFDLKGGKRAFATDMDGSGPVAITTHSVMYPEWSPRADRLAYVEAYDYATANPDNRLVVQTPEVTGVPVDIVGRTYLGGGTPFPQFRRMGRPNWSPDGSMIAFWVQENFGGSTYIVIYSWDRQRWFFPHEDATGGVSAFPVEAILCRTNGTPIAWAPNSDEFVYADGAGRLNRATHIRSGLGGINPVAGTGAPAAHTDAMDIHWAPTVMTSEGSKNNSFYYLRSSGEILRRKISDAANAYTVITDHAWVNPDSTPAAPPTYCTMETRGFALSPGGTELIYIDSDAPARKRLRIVAADGYDDQVLVDLVAEGVPDDLLEVGFLRPPQDWSYPAATVRKLTPSDPAGFDHQGWRIFINENSLYEGDSRFGNGYLQISPPANEEQFFFDNGQDIFRIAEEAPSETVPDTLGNPEPKTFGKIGASWGWTGNNFVAREAQDVTGGTPNDIFKQIVGSTVSGTTVLVTTGTDPAYGPGDQLLALSRRMSNSTTYPPNTAQYPPVDMDIWVVEANGGPNPPPTDLTPGTTATAESYPDWSPDGEYVYFQRERQVISRFLGNHSSGIYRTTRWGGAITPVVPEASIQPTWNDGFYVSALEFYEPSVSPDGTRLAFIARERLLGMGSLSPTLQSTRVGEIVGEALYVKDLLLNTPPTCLLRSIDSEIGDVIDSSGTAENNHAYFPRVKDGSLTEADPTDHTDLKAYADHGFHRPSWSRDGLRIFVNRTYPRNRWFPQKGLHRSGSVGHAAVRFKSYHQLLEYSQLIVVEATHPADDNGISKLPDSSFDPPADNFDVIVQNRDDDNTAPERYESNPEGSGPGPTFLWDAGPPPLELRQILNAQVSRGSYVFQRILQDVPATELSGLALDTDYVLSGYIRTRGGITGMHGGQIMCQLLNNQGLVMDLTSPGSKIYQMGIADIGGEQWTRFSAGIRFSPSEVKGEAAPNHSAPAYNNNADWGDQPPYSLLVCIYSLGEVGNTVEVTGLKMEKAYDPVSMAPTAFHPGWILHSSSLIPDPNRPKSFIFER